MQTRFVEEEAGNYGINFPRLWSNLLTRKQCGTTDHIVDCGSNFGVNTPKREKLGSYLLDHECNSWP